MTSSSLSVINLKKDIVAYARSLGFERVGITSAEPLKKEEAFLKTWIAEGRAGEMDYLEKQPERRTRPAELLPGAKSVIALAMSYASPQPSPDGRPGLPQSPVAPQSRVVAGGRRITGEAEVTEGHISRYANGRD